MRHPGLFAFALSLLLVGPGAVCWLNADGDAAPPAARVVAVGDARLTVSLDRAQVRPGERAGRPVVYLPTYRLARLDQAAVELYGRLGYAVRPIDVSAIYRHNGSLGCLVNVLERG